MFNKIVQQFAYGQHTVTLETGEIARQSDGAVTVSMGDTIVLATVVASKTPKHDQDFLPLNVEYIERAYSAGKIPGGFFKREGKPSEKEVLTSRLIDRPLRPLFPEHFYNDVQVIIHVLSVDPQIDPDIPAMIGASAAIEISGIPFKGPMGAARVGYINEKCVLNPTSSQLKESALNLVIAGTEQAVLMVESESKQLSEEVLLESVEFGHNHMQTVVEAIHNLVSRAGKPAWEWKPHIRNEKLTEEIKAIALEDLTVAYRIHEKQARSDCLQKLHTKVYEKLLAKATSSGDVPPDSVSVEKVLFKLASYVVRNQVLRGEPRIDGRDTRTVRPINIRLGVLPRAHGSALFTRGETQALVVTTLGTKQDEQIVDALMGEYRERFMLHYNMPPFATGEVGRIGLTKRREIGHGRLIKRALTPVLPSPEDFQYTLRIVSEITESNGSSSMASVCGGSLAMMDAGVPICNHVAGVAMGLILDGSRFAVLTDILGDEDRLGDMDFKVAGTEIGITALQMDIKIEGISKEIMRMALSQARDGRLSILKTMRESLQCSRGELSVFAPRLLTIKIKPDKIRDVIGKGGSNIKALTEETNTQVDISDDGTVVISSVDESQAQEAQRRILELSAGVSVGKVYAGPVLRLLDFGAIVQVLPGRDGLLHVSEIAHHRIANVKDVLKVGQVVKVKVIEEDEKGRLRLSIKAVGTD